MKYFHIVIITLCIAGLNSCKKSWLEKKPDKALVVPATIADFQALLDNSAIMNTSAVIGEISADDYFKTFDDWQNLSIYEQNTYTWSQHIYDDNSSTDWGRLYQQIYYANTVLQGMDKISKTISNEMSWNAAKGSAFFYRAYSFWQLMELFSKPYNAATADSDPGIPLKLSPDPNEKLPRASVKRSFEQAITDLQAAIKLLADLPKVKTRPSGASATALLARVYLSMGNYDQALVHVNASLSKYSTLIDYNSVDPNSSAPFPASFPETILYTEAGLISILYSNGYVDTTLYNSYTVDDLRKELFFQIEPNGKVLFRGHYTGYSIIEFSGVAVDELYLIRAECKARKGDITGAMDDLNTLLIKRWKTGTFSPMMAANADDALRQILKERRKELVFRNLRWFDLRRLNKDARFAKTLTRNLNGTIYTLPANDLKYVMPIPEPEIQQTGILQNPR